MKNKKVMSSYDKGRYLVYKIRTCFFACMFKTCFFAIFLFAFCLLLFPIDNKPICFFACWFSIVLLYFMFSKVFRVLLFRNVCITDGHIFKKHIFIKNSGSSDRNTGPFPCAMAISEDNSISTPWIYYPKSYFSKENANVKLIILKNEAIDFYIEF